VIIDEDDYLAHYGTPRHSGRYPWGSGGQHQMSNPEFLDYVDSLRAQGFTDTQIAQGLKTSTTELRAKRTIANAEKKQADISTAQRLKDKGMSNSAIGRRMGKNESSVRALLADGAADNAKILDATSEMLKQKVAEKQFIDVGTGVEQHIGISSTRLNAAVALLREQGYELHSVAVQQLGTGKNTTVKVLAPPGTTWGDVMKNRDKIQQIQDFSDDGGRSFLGVHPPLPIDPKRVAINYAEDGGSNADGVIFVRRGVDDVSLGNSLYAQVRVQVGDGHYLKGMAMYKDDLPPGVDLVFNTNKSNTGNKLDALKPLQRDLDGNIDKDNPFGAQLKAGGQRVIVNPDGTKSVTSVMNLVNEEGDWSTWSKTISTQMLSKQSPTLAKTQLNLTYEQRLKEFERLSALTNPTVKRTLLEKFGDETDSAAVQLDAAALSARQSWHVILPISSMPPNQVYAPNFNNGERVVLIRFPHGGRFEIPELTVNNKHPEARKLLDGARDAVGIHHSVAERLSGADFDGDTVLVIPNDSKKVQTAPALESLKGFDPKVIYKGYDGMPKMTDRQKKIEMGQVSNLITDMTLQGASTDKIARAVKHSMVVIDAQKHGLNYKQSAKDLGIAALKEEYQGRKNAGASTLISRATSEIGVPERKARPAAEGGPIDKETGKRVFVPTGATNWRTGKPKQTQVERLAIADDAHTLSSGTRIETIYADHSNKLKALANRARKESVNTPKLKYSESARKTYAAEVKALDARLALAIRNRPLERQAQILANTFYRARLNANPNMDVPTKKKIKAQALQEARLRTGASKHQIVITPEEWNAIQAGAISEHKLSQILAKADIETVRKLATPKPELLMTPVMKTRAKAMFDSGATRAEVAAQLGVSLTTLDTATNE
jgi:hypothetical protein